MISPARPLRDSFISSPTPQSTLPFWARIETLWLLFVPLCAIIYALLQPLAPNDLWYHVRGGELAAQLGHLPTTNSMSTGAPLDKPFYYQSWIGEALMYRTIAAFGLTGLQWLRAICLCSAFIILLVGAGRFARQQEIPLGAWARAGAAGSLWGFLMLSNNIDMRPQTFSVVLCAIWIALLLSFWRTPTWAKGIGLAVVAAVWANTHGAFVLAPASLFALSAGQLFFGRSKALWAATAASVVATLFNPRGLNLYIYLGQLSNNHIGQKYIQEWRSPSFSEWHGAFFLISPVFLALLWYFARPPKKWLPWLAPLVLVWVMGFRDQRSMIWFAMFMTPLAGWLFARLMPAPKPQDVPRAAQIINAFLLVLLAVTPLLFSPGIKTLLPWPDAFKSQYARTPQSVFPGDPDLLLDRTTPSTAVEWWNQNPGLAPDKENKKVWTDMVPGSFLTWATRKPMEGHGSILPLCDPRIELFRDDFWENYVRLSDGPRGAGDTLLQQHFTQALLDTESQPGLVRELKRERWQVVAHNGTTVLLVSPPTINATY